MPHAEMLSRVSPLIQHRSPLYGADDAWRCDLLVEWPAGAAERSPRRRRAASLPVAAAIRA